MLLDIFLGLQLCICTSLPLSYSDYESQFFSLNVYIIYICVCVFKQIEDREKTLIVKGGIDTILKLGQYRQRQWFNSFFLSIFLDFLESFLSFSFIFYFLYFLCFLWIHHAILYLVKEWRDGRAIEWSYLSVHNFFFQNFVGKNSQELYFWIFQSFSCFKDIQNGIKSVFLWYRTPWAIP